MRARVVPLTLSPGRRVLVIGDIHGELGMLKGLLKTAGFCREDLLIFLGDLVEKGPDSLGTLRYVMDLAQGGNVRFVQGNCDSIAPNFIAGRVPDEFMLWFSGRWGRHTLLAEMALELGIPMDGAEDYPALRREVGAAFARELAFLGALPTVLETPCFLFVHGGVPSDEPEVLETLDDYACMKNDFFLDQDSRLRRWCIVGHTPVTLYRPDIPSAKPIVCREKHIVSIDGGCCLKKDGQLNALVLPAGEEDGFSYYSWDGFPLVRALDGQEASEQSINLRWSEREVEVLERGAEFTRCRHKKSGRVLEVLSDYLYREGETVCCEDSTDYRLPVRPGELLSVVRKTGRGLLAKKNGVTGWYSGRVEAPAGERGLSFPAAL